ncbi:GHKL domain-containing protein [Bacillus sp. SM2101]|uniref:sensor histidine kinase n=1 Tax=Bacillus sp. SM2101 TaxID=2805366 RepID=UPI001BDEAD35
MNLRIFHTSVIFIVLLLSSLTVIHKLFLSINAIITFSIVYAVVWLFLWKKVQKIFFQVEAILLLSSILWLVQIIIVFLQFYSNKPIVVTSLWVVNMLVECFRWSSLGKIQLLLLNESVLQEEQMGIQDAFREIRSQRHDVMKHMNVFQYMLEEERLIEARSYVESLIGEYENVNLTIKGEKGHITAHLHHYYVEAMKEGVDVTYQLQVPLTLLPMSNLDQSKLVSNLLENSVEAAAGYSRVHKEGSVVLKSSMVSGFYILESVNHTEPIPKHIIDSLFTSYGQSSKGKHRGFGTTIINDIINEYHGKITYTYDTPSLYIKIKMPIVKN